MIIKLTDLGNRARKIRGGKKKKPCPVTPHGSLPLKNPCSSCFCQARQYACKFNLTEEAAQHRQKMTKSDCKRGTAKCLHSSQNPPRETNSHNCNKPRLRHSLEVCGANTFSFHFKISFKSA